MHRKLQASSEVDIPTWNFFTVPCPQFPVPSSSSLSPVLCLQFPVPTSLSPVCCVSPCPSSLPPTSLSPLPVPSFPVPSLLPPVPCPPVPCPSPVPSLLPPVPCPPGPGCSNGFVGQAGQGCGSLFPCFGVGVQDVVRLAEGVSGAQVLSLAQHFQEQVRRRTHAQPDLFGQVRNAPAEPFFLHESRRYVCRFCTSHLIRVKKELLSRLQSIRETTNNQNKNPTNQHTTHKHQRGSNLLRNSLGHVGRVKKVRQGEPGATNSARCSVVLVPQRSHMQVSTSVRVLVHLVQWRLQTSPSWLVAKTRFSPMHCRIHRPAPMSSYQSGPQAKIGQPCKSGELLSGRHRPSTHRQEVAGRGRPQPW